MADVDRRSDGERQRKVIIKKKSDIRQHQQEELSSRQHQTPPTANKAKMVMTNTSKKTVEESHHISTSSIHLDTKSSVRSHHLVTNGVDKEKSAFLNHSNSLQESSTIKIDPLIDEVRPAIDPAKVVQKFNQKSTEVNVPCKICGKHVYQMEKLKAEKAIFHKLCFRCKECKRLLTVDSYNSHEGNIYCKQHFRQLFQPKVKLDSDDDPAPRRQRKHEMIIRENIPEELPPDVVRCDSKPDYGLESLPSLHDVKSRFESGLLETDSLRPPSRSSADIHRSESIMQRLARYESAVRGESHENGDGGSSESEDDEGETHIISRDSSAKEQVPFTGLSNLKTQWEKGAVKSQKEDIIEVKKEELKRLRQRMCLGRSESMKMVYERACQEATTPTRSETVVLNTHADKIKEKFEKGQVSNDLEHEKVEKMRSEKEEDLSVVSETGIAHNARSLFKQMDANAKTATSPVMSPSRDFHKSRMAALNHTTSPTDEVVKCSEPTSKEEIHVETKEISQRFKFFENYQEEPKERKRFQITPPREPPKAESPEPEIQRDPSIVRCTIPNGHDEIPITDTARKMLDKFKAMEEARDPAPSGPKPLKRITPPREFTVVPPPPEDDENVVRPTYRVEDEIKVEADMAKTLREKFERWQHDMATSPDPHHTEEDDLMPQIDTAKNLRAKFEAIKEEGLQAKDKPRPRVKRFV